MGSIISAIEAIDALQFVQIKTGRSPDVTKCLSLGEGAYLLELKGGQYTVIGGWNEQRLLNGNHAVLGFGETSTPGGAVLDGLVRLGVLTRDQVKQHQELVAAQNAKRRRKRDLQDLERACKDLGIPVPEVPDGA